VILAREAYENFMARHPRPTHNNRGEPRWAGSEAEKCLKQDMQEGKHFKSNGDRLTPAEFRCLRPVYQEYLLSTIRSHIDQEIRLKNYHNFLELEEKKKEDLQKKAIARARKRQPPPKND